MILAMGIFYGGLGCYRWHNVFQTWWHVRQATNRIYLLRPIWLSLVGLIVMPYMGLPASPAASAVGTYLWGTLHFMFIGSLCYPVAKQVVFGSLTILFFLLAARDFTGSQPIGTTLVSKVSSVALQPSTSQWHKQSTTNTAAQYCLSVRGQHSMATQEIAA